MAKTKKTTTDSKAGSKAGEAHTFQAEVSKLLDLMINSLYREKDIFLRELISNASDACDKLRYAALTDGDLLSDDTPLAVTITPDKDARTLTIADNGIGMDHDELIANLGTIAKSGTEAFVGEMSGDAAKDVSLIGRFGVGFYAAFMVAERVEVVSMRAGDDKGWRWESDGRGGFSVDTDDSASRGARIILHLRDGEDEFLEPGRLRTVIKTYSDHVAMPIRLVEGDGEPETLNEASAIWARPKSEIDEAGYAEFYRHVAHSPGEPWQTIHMQAEGTIEYSALLFVPDAPPFDLFDSARQHRVRLYVRRVFITDECEGLVPPYLRFLRGVVDSSDLPLNISRETLQHNPVLAKIRSGVVKKVLSELKSRTKDTDAYTEFWKNFGAVLKEGLYEDPEQKDSILELARFRTSADPDSWVSLDAYVARMPENQSAIYYLSGENEAALRQSPHLEGFRARGLEVLLMTDPVDQFWLPAIGPYKEKEFRSVTQGSADLDTFAPTEEAAPDDAAPAESDVSRLIASVKLTLGDEIKDVRTSDRLTDSPVCLVADEGDMDIHLERLLRMHKQAVPEQSRVLEINPRHDMIRGLITMVSEDGAADALGDAAHILLDQARILEGQPVRDPVEFTRRISALVARSVKAGGD
ncbi:MAG: molecular chaperone HtpG [Alphaproteobacteria bacterium]|jgi:molecular chaperone HtpG|nr:molecular chaperone HtpG [Alphaproteobacteria bacterium]